MTGDDLTVRSRFVARWLYPLAAFALAATATLLCSAVTGATLGLFIAGLVVASILVTTLLTSESRGRSQLFTAAAIVLGVAIPWEMKCFDVFPRELMPRAVFILTAWTIALAGATRLLARLIRAEVVASAIITIFALAWLAWPFWLRVDSFADKTVKRLVDLNPIFVIDGQSNDLDVWTQRPVIYQFMALGQDIPYSLPKSMWPMVSIFGSIGSAMWVASTWRSRRRDETETHFG